METKDIINELTSLAQLDIDAIHAYDQAIKNTDVLSIREQLAQLKADHERHVRDLSDAILNMRGQPPAFTPDFKGFLIQGFTAVRSATGTEGALNAMRGNEILTNRTYARALSLDFPAEVKALVQKNLSDEQRHLRSIEQWLSSRAWEQAGVTP